ncbi:AAA family ATPase [Actinoplanes sp. NPDC048796]|uniref:ATP-binding protein n=1 Tax=Actinoplanes sp. NPDC048796 TaxID=3155640 RepID=UPI0033EC01FE
MPEGSGRAELRGRRRERDVLERLLREVRGGRSRALVLRGEAGCGKTALLDHLADRADFARVLRAAGVQSESEIAYSGLQQLCAPLLGELDRLPPPQRDALATAFGLGSGHAPDQLLVGLAVLGLFAEAGAGRPLLCVVDDVQWIDAMSAVILSFVARRLDTEAVALVFAARTTDDGNTLGGLPELLIEGLPDADARALLDATLTGPVDPGVRDRIVAEARGNPLALIELPRNMSPAELAFGFGGYHPMPLTSRLEEGFQRRIAALPADTRTVLLAAAVEPVGDAQLLWRALEQLGVGRDAAEPAQAARLIDVDTRVRFKHPLVRSAAWRCGRIAEVRAVHAALAEATDPERDPDRRAWHRAHAADGPDDAVAAELEQSAGRALARGGPSAAAAFLERAAELTLDGAHRGALLVAAASARLDAGAYSRVPELLGAAQLGSIDPLHQARVERLRAQVMFMLTPGRAAGPPLLAAAHRLEPLDPAAARDAFLSAIGAAVYAGRFGGDDLRTAARAARAVPAAGQSFPDLLLTGLVSWILDDRATSRPLLERALDALNPAEHIGLLWLIQPAVHELFRIDLAYRLSAEAVAHARRTGVLRLLPAALTLRSGSLLYAGRFADAANLLDEGDAMTRATAAPLQQSAGLALAAYRGQEKPARKLIEAKLRDATTRGDGRLHTLAHHVKAALYNGIGDHRAALEAAREATAYTDLGLPHFPLREMAEAAARLGEREIVVEARDRLAERTADVRTRWARGTQAIADALADPAATAEDRYREAIEHLSVTETTTEAFRARLLYGEWLLRAGRDADARVELRAAHQAFTTMGAEGFAERARRELAGAGENVRRPAADARRDLTAQETSIIRLAVDGRTNAEIGAALFLSPRTVEWHIRKIFTKLGVTSRRELATTWKGAPDL